MNDRSLDWLRQAENDLSWSKDAFGGVESMSGVIVWHTRDPLYGMDPPGLEEALRGRLVDRVESAWLFGSLARGDYGPDSDIDLLLVTETTEPFTRRPALFDDLYERFPALDALVYTPREFKSPTEDPSPRFWREVTLEMRRIV